MLTEVDIERIMAAQRQLTESVTNKSTEIRDLREDDELLELIYLDTSVSETNGLM